MRHSRTRARMLPAKMNFRLPNKSELAPQVMKAIHTTSTKLVTYHGAAVKSPRSVAIALPAAVTAGIGQNAAPNCKESICRS